MNEDPARGYGVLRPIGKAHPWHGVSTGEEAPEIVNCYIEIVPTDTVKYEIDKTTGYLKIDRPQKYSNHCPALYGFVPQTLCLSQVGDFCAAKCGRPGIAGDGDPIDICVLTEKPIQHADILLRAAPIGGLRMIDRSQADDKIIAVLYGDEVFGEWSDITDVPAIMIERLRHYFLTYKDIPGVEERKMEFAGLYGAAEARHIISLSCQDYRLSFPDMPSLNKQA